MNKDVCVMPKKKKNDAVVRQSGWLAGNIAAPALVEGEDVRAYNALLDEIVVAVKPKDIFEEIFVRDFVDLQWELMRWRRSNAVLMNSDLYLTVREVLTPICGMAEAMTLADGCAKHDPKVLERVREVLEATGMNAEVLSARSLARRIEHVERIDRMAATAEMRRRSALQELRTHRREFAAAMRAVNEKIEDGECKEVKGTEDEVAAAVA
jgi:hypothetical protein